MNMIYNWYLLGGNTGRSLARLVIGITTAVLSTIIGQADWKVGFGKVDITPAKPMFLSGYASRDKPFESIESRLYAKAMALEDSSGNRALLITSDLLGFQSYFAEPMCERIMQSTGLTRDQILLNSSHTHTGPLLNPDPRFGLDSEQSQHVKDYVDWLATQIVNLSQRAVKNVQTATLSHGTGVAPFVMNRREFTASGVKLGVNPRGVADRSVPVLRIDGPDEYLRGVVFGCATHNTTPGAIYSVCGDYAGFAQSFLEDKYPGVQAMFMMGCAGDSNPYPRGSLEHSRKHGGTLGTEVARVLQSKLRSIEGPLRLAYSFVDLPLQPHSDRSTLEEWKKSAGGWKGYNASRMLDLIDRGRISSRTFPYPVSVWQLGNDLTMIGLAGEVVVDYVNGLERTLGPLNLWVAGYCNDNFGYLPSARVIREGGYETRGIIYGDVGYFTPQAEQILIDAVKSMAKEAGRSTD